MIGSLQLTHRGEKRLEQQPFISVIRKVSTYSQAKLSHFTSIKQLNERGQKANSEFEFTSNSELEFSAVKRGDTNMETMTKQSINNDRLYSLLIIEQCKNIQECLQATRLNIPVTS